MYIKAGVANAAGIDLRKYNFTNRVIPIWNSWPNFVVSAGTVNTFKNRLDKFWSDQDILYDYKADLHGIGNGNWTLRLRDISPTRHFAYDMDISPIHDMSPPITLLDRRNLWLCPPKFKWLT